MRTSCTSNLNVPISCTLNLNVPTSCSTATCAARVYWSWTRSAITVMVILYILILFIIYFIASARERSPSPAIFETVQIPRDSKPLMYRLQTLILHLQRRHLPWSIILHNTNTGIASHFAPKIFNHNYISKLYTDYLDSNLFKHAVLENIFTSGEGRVFETQFYSKGDG